MTYFVWDDELGYIAVEEDDDEKEGSPVNNKKCNECRYTSEILSKEKDKLYCVWESKHVLPSDCACEWIKDWTIK